MTQDDVYTAYLDRYHRHWPVAVWAVIQAVIVLAYASEFRVAMLPRILLVSMLVGALFGAMWLGQRRRRIIISSGGVVEHGWFFDTVARFADVTRHTMVLDSDALGINTTDDIGEFFVSLFAQFTVRPLRWILRRTIYGGQSDVFYRGKLTLHGDLDKPLIRIEASDGWEDVEEVFRRITHKVETYDSVGASSE